MSKEINFLPLRKNPVTISFRKMNSEEYEKIINYILKEKSKRKKSKGRKSKEEKKLSKKM